MHSCGTAAVEADAWDGVRGRVLLLLVYAAASYDMCRDKRMNPRTPNALHLLMWPVALGNAVLCAAGLKGRGSVCATDVLQLHLRWHSSCL